MSQRPLLFVVMLACLSSGVPVWSQIRLHAGNRQDAVKALNADRHEPGHNRWRNVGIFGSERFRKGEAGSRWGPWRKCRGFYKGMACPDPRLASP